MDIELIEWIDSSSLGRWHNEKVHTDHARESLACSSVGFVIYESVDRVAFTQSVTVGKPDTSYDSSLVIPKVAITKRQVLVAGDKPGEPKP